MPSIFIIRRAPILRVDHKYKITILVALQISLIVTSFVMIAYLESQTNHTGSVVNVAGKNRVLTSQVHVTLNQVLLEDVSDETPVLMALERLEDNILFLKNGGTVDEIMLYPLPPRFDDEWNAVWITFMEYKASVSNLVKERGMLAKNMGIIVESSNTLVHLSDVLTIKLSEDAERFTAQLVMLQIVLGIINVVAHVFMIFMIWRIFNDYAEQRAKTEKFAMLGKFAAIIAHDMRNPLGAIRNSTVLIRDSGDNKAISDETERISRAVKRMSHQVEGVLNYVRNVPLVLEHASIRKIIDQSIDNVSVPGTITVTVPDKDATVRCDAEKLEFVFTNILLNAIQAIGDERGHILVGLDEMHDGVVLSFENSGASIPEGDMSKIFEPLFTTRMQGTGLGLTSCKNIIKRHQGIINVSNNPVTFTIELPK